MILSFYLIIAILLVVIGFQVYSKRKINKQLGEIVNRLSSIIEKESAEKVLFQTDQEAIKLFLIHINRLLDYNQKVIADYARTKESLRKMISNMSHDMKTPLTVMLGYVEKLKLNRQMSQNEMIETIDRLHLKTMSVISLLNQFFDFVKLESGDYAIPLKRVCINEVCRKNVLEFYDLLQSNNLQVKIDIPEKPLYILGNEEALDRILNNLISNAIRYGGEGGVFGLTLHENEDYVAIDIWDKGAGISKIHQEKVFDRLYTLDDARNSEFQGSGLGLSITKNLIESMKGSIQLSSEPFEKTVFSCVFKRISY